MARDTLVLELGDQEGLEECFKHYGDDIAAIIVEPLVANHGLRLPDRRALGALRALATQKGALLIFDEVISGFRVGPGGISEKFGIIPDLVLYGKIVGGGLPVGAIAGPRALMEKLSPTGDVYQAGTLSANPLAMVAGMATLEALTPQVYSALEKSTHRIVSLLGEWLARHNNGEFRDYEIVFYSSLFWPRPKATTTLPLSGPLQSTPVTRDFPFPQRL